MTPSPSETPKVGLLSITLDSLSIAAEKTRETLSATVSRKGLGLSLLLFALLSFGLGAMEQGHLPEDRGQSLLEERARDLGVEAPSAASAQAREMILGNTAYMVGYMLGGFVSALFMGVLAWLGCRTAFVIYEGVVSGGITFRKSFSETSKVGNSLFFFWMFWFFLGQVVTILTVFSLGSPGVLLVQFALLGFLFMLGMCFWVVGGVIVPIMGHDRVGVLTAWGQWMGLFRTRPGAMMFYFPVSLAVGVFVGVFAVTVWLCVALVALLLGALVLGAPWFLAGGTFSSLPTAGLVWLWLVPAGLVLALVGLGLGLSTSVIPGTVFYRAWSLAFLQGVFPERFSFFSLIKKEEEPRQ